MLGIREKLETRLALVVDDSAIQREIISAFLEEEGYQSITACNGAEGVEMYVKHQPDLVLMDINMPVMNGFDAVRKIKKLENDNVAPIIFITGDDSEQAFIDVIEAGGDDRLSHPFSAAVFKAKIKSVQRMSDLYRKVKLLQQEQQNDAHIAENLMSNVIESKNYSVDRIRIVKQAAEIFSGDIHLTALAPNGDINILLGDFTGHGLRSTIGAVPLSETFRVMTNKGFSPLEIISQANRQLNGLLPTDLFLSATFVTISNHHKTAYIFNAGLPDTYIFDENAKIKHKIVSCHPPLGILKELLPNAELTAIPIGEKERIILISDGIIEAKNKAGEMFDYTRFENAVALGIKKGDVAQAVLKKLGIFCKSAPQDDDISLIDIPCGGWEEAYIGQRTFNDPDSTDADESFYSEMPAWEWQLKLGAERLRGVNPIPIIMNQIIAIEGAAPQWQSLYTILTELFVNALDHGVLGLNSELKSAADGFILYFNEREKRLGQLETGCVDISLKYFSSTSGGKLTINVKDSGSGFDLLAVTKQLQTSSEAKVTFSGRGLQLVTQLCDSVEFKENGTLVEAVYLWR